MAQDAIGVSDVWRTSLELDSSQFTKVQSASGKGKSTLLHILCGIRRDFEGEVTIDGKDVRSWDQNDWAKWRQEKCAILFQDMKLFHELSGMENIRLKAELSGSFNETQITQWAEQLGVAQYLQKPSGQLSLGQQQRMAMIRALAQPFEWLLLDEPFSHLDVENQKLGCQLITDVCKSKGAGLLLTTLGEPYFFEYDRELKI